MDFGIDQQRRRGENPGVSGISLRSPKRSTSGQRSVEQPSCLSQRSLDLGEVANTHHLENQPVDFGFEFIQGQGTVALPTSWLPGDRSRGFLTRSSWFFAGGGCHRLGLLGLPTKVARQTQGCSHLVDEGSTDGPVESGCLPSLVHGFDVALGIVVEELFQEAGLAWSNGCRPGNVEAAFSLAAFLVFPGRLPVSFTLV